MSPLTITCLVIFALTMIGFAVGNKWVPLSVISLISMVALVLTGCLDKNDALSCFSNGNVVMLGSMFIVAGGLNRTQLSKNISAYVVKIAKGSFSKVLAGYCILTFILAQFIYSPLAISAVVFPMTINVCKELKVRPSKMIYPVMLVAIGTCPATPFSVALQETAAIQGMMDAFYPGATFNTMAFFTARIVPCVLLTIYAILVAPRFCPDRASADEAELAQTKAEPAPLDPVREVIAYVTFFAVMFGLFFSSQIGLSSWQIALIGALIVAATGVLNKKELVSNMSIGMLLLYVGCLAIGKALSNTGAADLIGEACGAIIMTSRSNYLAGFIFLIVPFILTQFMLNTGILTIFYAVWSMTCASMGVDPTAAIILAYTGACTAFMTPLATPAVPLAMKFGNYDFKDMVKMGLLPAVIVIVISVFSVMTIYPIF